MTRRGEMVGREAGDRSSHREHSPAASEGARRSWGSRREPVTYEATAAAVYACVSAPVLAKLNAYWRTHFRRSRSMSGKGATRLAGLLNEVAAAMRAGDDGGFAEAVCEAVRAAALAHGTEQTSLLSLICDTQRADAEEDVHEVALYEGGLTDRATVLRVAAAKARAGRAELRCAALLRQHAESLR